MILIKIPALMEKQKYKYNGKDYTQIEYARLIHKKTGVLVGTIAGRIRKGWSIEKLMLPDAVKKPIIQYSINGEFIKSYTSVTEAVIELQKKGKKTSTAGICDSLKSEKRISGGYIWRYADLTKDPPLTINTFQSKKFNGDEDLKYLRDKYVMMMEYCYKPGGRYYSNEKIKVWDEWKSDFEKFYNDMLPLYKKAKKKNPSYKRRTEYVDGLEKLKVNHIWFTRFDKTEGYMPFNICFTTPNWTMRYKPATNRVIFDRKIVSVPQIFDILKEQHKSNLKIKEATVRQRIKNKKTINNINESSKFEYKGLFYSLVELAKMFSTTRAKITSYINKGNTLDEVITKIQNEVKHNPRKVSYLSQEYTINKFAKKIKNENNSDLDFDTIRGRVKKLKYNSLNDNDIELILNTKKRQHTNLVIEHEGISYPLVDLSKKYNISYETLFQRYKKGVEFKDLISKPIIGSNQYLKKMVR